jgi:hypothetical protein
VFQKEAYNLSYNFPIPNPNLEYLEGFSYFPTTGLEQGNFLLFGFAV